jgi:cytochrome c oxidase assembly protein subunit 11
MASTQTKNRRAALMLSVFAAGMVGLAFASVPLYQLFCQVTGYGGTPNINLAGTSQVVSDRVIDVRFDANTNKGLPWRFKPVQNKLTVKLGESNLAFYRARNTSDETITGTAVFNVTPHKVASYFSKIDCFCFTEQTLKPGAVADLPVEFYVDPEIFSDPTTKEVKAITLSYTFYRSEKDIGDDGDKTAQQNVTKLNKIEG